MFYFNGSQVCKLDSKNRFVMPISMRHGLVQDGEIKFALGLGLGGCLAVYKADTIEEIVKKFKEKMHMGKYQKFFTLFFSTLHKTTCDNVGRVTIPPLLKQACNIGNEIVVAGVMDKIEIWPKEVHEKNLALAMQEGDLAKISEEGFALLNDAKPLHSLMDQEEFV